MKISTHLGIPCTVALSGETSYLFVLNWSPLGFGQLALLPPTRFYCGTMQNGTGWNSALIWGFPAQLHSLEKPVTYSFWIWAPSVSRHLPCCPQLDFIVELCRMALDENPHSFGDSPHSCLVWRSQLLIRFELEPPRFRPLALLPPTRFYCGTMQNGPGWKSALIWGFPAQLPCLEKPVTYSFWIWAPSVSGTCPVAPN